MVLWKPYLYLKGSLKALTDFCQLEKLEIPLQFLLASFRPATGIQLKDMVPKYIQSLTITDDLQGQEEQNEWEDTELYNFIALWLQDWRVSKPNLRTIALLPNQSGYDWSFGIRPELKELCDQYGLEAKNNQDMEGCVI
jgi:hypothetical protein